MAVKSILLVRSSRIGSLRSKSGILEPILWLGHFQENIKFCIVIFEVGIDSTVVKHQTDNSKDYIIPHLKYLLQYNSQTDLILIGLEIQLTDVREHFEEFLYG